MSSARNKRTEQATGQPDLNARQITDIRSGISDADVARIADELERRVLGLFRPVPAPMPEVSPRHVDLDDLIGPKEAAALVGRHEKTIHRWMRDFDISFVVAGTKCISHRKLLAHVSRNNGENDS